MAVAVGLGRCLVQLLECVVEIGNFRVACQGYNLFDWSQCLAQQSCRFVHPQIQKIGTGACSELLFKNTSKFDQLLAKLFYWLLMISGLSGALLVLLNSLGVFNE